MSVFRDWAEAYRERGLSPLPIVQGTKRPSVTNWTEYCNRNPNPSEIAEWAGAFPEAGLGIALGTTIDQDANIHLVAIDIDQGDYVRSIKRTILGDKTNKGAVFVGKRGSKGQTFFARTSECLRGEKIKNDSGMVFELLSRGQQTVVPPTMHPEINQRYRWLGKTTLLNAPLDRLPVITAEMVEQIRFAVSRPIGGTQEEALVEHQAANSNTVIRYLGDGCFDAPEIAYPGNVNDMGWRLTGAAARHNLRFGQDTEEEKYVAIEGIVNLQFDACARSGTGENWDRQRQVAEVGSQYDRHLTALKKQSDTRNQKFGATGLKIIRAADLHGQTIPNRKWLVDTWIPHGEVVALYGDGGIGKSLLSLQLMVCCALGRPWLGLKTMACPTFGLFCEDRADEVQRRLAAILKHNGASFGDLGDRMFYASRVGDDNFLVRFAGEGVSSAPTLLLTNLQRYVERLRPGLVVIDTAADTFGGNENNRAQVRHYIAQGLGSLATASDGTVVVCAHPSRQGLQQGTGSGGSTAWNNGFRARLYLQKLESGNHQRVLSRKKSNYGPVEGEEIPLNWRDGAFVRLDGAGADALIRRKKAQDAFLAALDAHPGPLSNSINSGNYAPTALALNPEAQEFSKAELQVAMTDLLRQGTLEIVMEGPASKQRRSLRRATTAAAQDAGPATEDAA